MNQKTTFSQKSRFEPTYKELKLRQGVQFEGVSLSFEPTYKELKPVPYDLGQHKFLCVLSLPIRN